MLLGLIGLAVGFTAGLLIGRNNKSLANAAATDANAAKAAASQVASKL